MAVLHRSSSSSSCFANPWFDYAIILLLIIASLVIIYLYGIERALITPIFHLDGAFQTASSLFRLSDGQLPGRDYLPYLGLGTTYLLWPLFIACGETLAASQFAAYAGFLASAAVTVGILTALIMPRHKLLLASVTSLLFILCFLVFSSTIPYILQSILFIEPGNSLRPLRSFIVYVAGLAIYLTILNISAGRACWIVLGAIAGLAVLWSNDYGIPTAGMTGLFGLWWANRHSKKIIPAGLWMGGTGFIVAAIGMTILTGGHPIALLEYNFVDVAGDQYWYFGAWDEKNRLFGLADIYKILFPLGLIGLGGLLASTIIVVCRPTTENALLYAISWMLLGGGLIATIGGHIDAYFQAYEQLVVLIMLLTIMRFGWPWLVQRNNWLWQRWQTLPTHGGQQRRVWLGMAVAVLAVIGARYGYYQHRHQYFASNEEYAYVAAYDGYLHQDWHQHLNFIKANQNASVVEEYWGLWGAYTGAGQGAPVDSAIHAMGGVRDAFTEHLQTNPEFVVTTLPSMSVWATWNITANWWFYKPLLQQYAPQPTSLTTLVWQRQPTAYSWPKVACAVEQATDTATPAVVLPGATPGFYDVTVQYQADLQARSLLLIDTGIHKVIHKEGYLSINPEGNEVNVPVKVAQKLTRDSKPPRFDFQVESKREVLIGNTDALTLQGCTARRISNDKYLIDLTDYGYWDFADTALILKYKEPEEIPFLMQDKNWQQYSNWERFWLLK